MKKIVGLLPFFLAECVFYWASTPVGLAANAYHYALLFMATIFAILLQFFPMAVCVLVGTWLLVFHQLLSISEALSGFGHSIAWLVVAAFMIARSVIDSGLGKRIAQGIMAVLGRRLLGLAYGVFLAEMVLGALIPSSTARGGGIIAPVVDALARDLQDGDKKNTGIGAFLFLVATHANILSSATFLTAMVGNPLVVQAAYSVYKIQLTWGMWFVGALLPMCVTFFSAPPLLAWLCGLKNLDLQNQQKKLYQDFLAMGALSAKEIKTLMILVVMVIGWMSEPVHGYSATWVTMLGVLGLMIAGVSSWQTYLAEKKAWDALVWLGGLIMLGEGLRQVGAVDYLVDMVRALSQGLSPWSVYFLVMLVYFYSMYVFSVATAHVLAFAVPIFGLMQALGLPSMMVVAVFAYFSNLCVCLTNYSTGPVVIFYGYGYVSVPQWFRVGFYMSLLYVAIWLGIGFFWWRFLGWG